jgi:hypothetical protein
MNKLSRRNILAPSLARYGLAAGAAVSAGTSPASASIVLVNTPFTVSQDNPNFFWHVDGGGTPDFDFNLFSAFGAARLSVHNAAATYVDGFVIHTQGAVFAVKAAPGLHLGPSLGSTPFLPHGVYHNHAYFTGSGDPFYLAAGQNFVGFRFVDGAQTDYGWANITLNPSSNPAITSITIHNWAYDNTGAAITVGQVPEPAQSAAGLGLLALGAAGVSAYKRRRLNK